jgi:hypothetical protein
MTAPQANPGPHGVAWGRQTQAVALATSVANRQANPVIDTIAGKPRSMVLEPASQLLTQDDVYSLGHDMHSSRIRCSFSTRLCTRFPCGGINARHRSSRPFS